MWQKLTFSVAVLAACAGMARASDKDDVKSALQKLADSPNYSWKTTIEGGMGAGENTGKTQKDGLTTLSITRQDNTFEAVVQGDKGAVKTDDGWKSVSELTAGGGGGGGPSPERFMAMAVQNFKTPTTTGLELVDKLENVKKIEGGYTADLSEEGAKTFLTMRRRPGGNGAAPKISNAKAEMKIWVKEGTVTKIENHVTGTVTFNGKDNDVDRTSTTEFSDVGSTKVMVPDEAKSKMTAAAKP